MIRALDFIFVNHASGEFRRPRPLARFFAVEVVGPIVYFVQYLRGRAQPEVQRRRREA